MTSNSYAGIGSRETPNHILVVMTEFAQLATEYDWVLRSGGAPGADQAFELGAAKKEIYLPSRGFYDNPSPLYPPTTSAMQMAAKCHPIWKGLQPFPKLLVARNMHQIFGFDMNSPVEFVICWTRDGCESYKTYTRNTGGTGSAISAASRADIPVYNLYNKGRLEDALEHLTTGKRKEIEIW